MRQADDTWGPSGDESGDARRDAGSTAVQHSGTARIAAPRQDDHDDPGTTVGWLELAEWARRRRVVLAALALIVFQLCLKALFLSHFFFTEDDFRFLDRGLDNGLTWKYLMWVDAGHLIPGPFALAWVLARIGLYDWALASAVTLVILAAACLALLRLLRNLFGDRPAILIPLTIYLFSPLTLAALGFWAVAIESLPLQVSTFMALDAHVRYLRTGRYRQVVGAAAWLAVGMLFFEKGVVLPPLLFAVTSAFFVEGYWLAAARRTAARYWRAWLLYAAVLAAYATLFLFRLSASGSQPVSTGPYRHVLAFMLDLVKNTFVPGALGGPWQWLSHQPTAYSLPPAALSELSWLVAAVIVVASIWNRQYAWRAWAILAAWLVLADMAPAIAGRTRAFGSLVALDSHYVADAVPILAVCLGLAFWPVAGQRDRRRKRRHPSAAARQATLRATSAVLGVFVVGSLWSLQAYVNDTTSVPARAYIDNARAAFTAAPYGTVVVDGRVPSTVMISLWFGRYGFASKVIGAMARGDPPSQLRWTTRPAGTIDHLMMFGQDGRLWPAALYGSASTPLPPGKKCWPAKHGQVVVTMPPVTTKGTSTLRIGYFLPTAEQVSVQFGGQSQQLTLQPGLHNAYLPVRGSGRTVTVTSLGPEQLCIGNAAVGVPLLSGAGPAIPATPVAR